MLLFSLQSSELRLYSLIHFCVLIYIQSKAFLIPLYKLQNQNHELNLKKAARKLCKRANANLENENERSKELISVCSNIICNELSKCWNLEFMFFIMLKKQKRLDSIAAYTENLSLH